MRVLIDGSEAYAAHSDTINTNLKLFTGTHQITVQSLDSSGNATASASVNVHAEPGDAPPDATIILTALPSISPTTVLGCTATSSDPDGFLINHKLQYSNGSKFSTVGAVENFSAAGTYTATATVTDQFGATSTTSKSFNVSGGHVSFVSSSGSQQSAPQQQSPIEPMQPPQQ
jgi:hypothetical protein